MLPPILSNKVYSSPSVFTADNLLREARRQKALPQRPVPPVCILDPDGDIARYLTAGDLAQAETTWACYHTQMFTFEQDALMFGIVPNVVGASFAVLVAEELFASGCELLISVTSAGQILPLGTPPYFVLIDRALRDEGTSYHYLPPAPYAALRPALLAQMRQVVDHSAIQMFQGATWTTDAPFRETPEAIAFAHQEGLFGVEMEAAALYAFSEVKDKPVICFAHITNQMAQIEGDFEKGRDMGSHAALEVIRHAARAFFSSATG